MEYFKRIFSYSRKYLVHNIIGIILSFASIFVVMVNPYLTKLIVDEGLMKKDFGRLKFLLAALLLTTLLRVAIRFIRILIFEYTSQKVLYDLRSDLYDNLQGQSFVFYDKIRTGSLMNRMVGDLEAIRNFLNAGYVQLVEGIVSLITAFAVMMSIDIKLTLVVSIILPFVYFNTRNMAKVMHPMFKDIRWAFEKLTSYVQENITGIRVVKAFGMEDQEKAKFDEIARDYSDKNITVADTRSRYAPFAQALNQVGTVIILLYGGYLAIRGEITVGSIVAFNSYLLMLSNPINNMNNLVNQWENAMASMDKVFELMDQKAAVRNKDNAVALGRIEGSIEFKDVSFKYNDKYVLKDINLNISPGRVTAIMGATGSGKSTMINLIARFYDCSKGKILVDGYDVRDVDMNSLRSNIGIIFQETFLFSDTIGANIAFGRPDATMDEIRRAAQIADAHGFIEQMPEQYETVVGERGIGLSGGQKQRIAIARAILCDPKILVLDDATSSVDMETEQEIQKTIKKVMDKRTTLIIAHRISSVKDADEIIFLDEGKIVERGTHEELLKLRGRYYQTFAEQYKEYTAVVEGNVNLKAAAGV